MSKVNAERIDEIWKKIRDYPNYSVSDRGNVRNDKTGRILKPLEVGWGYVVVELWNEYGVRSKKIHRLVADAFVDNPEGKPQVNHIDGNKKNNCKENLEWVTASENMKHAYDYGIRMPHQERPIRIVETGEVFSSIKECAEKINGHECDISRCLKQPTSRGCTQANGHTHMGLHFEYATNNNINKISNFLYDFQMEAVKKAFVGCVFNGQVGSGKSRTGLFFYFQSQGGWIDENGYIPMKNPKDLFIITTAMKRDKHEWEGELIPFEMYPKPELNRYDNKIIIDSWNNIQKYIDVKNAWFIFDEQRVVGKGAWVKSFLKIAKNNDWIMLSATPGDVWLDYVPLFIANGFYRNRTEFINAHVDYDPRCRNFPKIKGYRDTGRLIRLRNKILIDMDFKRPTVQHHEDVYCSYDVAKYKDSIRNRWDPFKDEPIQQAAGLCYVLRKIVNTDESRQVKLLELLEEHPKAIVFYGFDYERDILLNLGYEEGTEVAEWSGHAHQPIPTGDKWVYLVQWVAGCEGWNTITTDTVIFYSQNYSYKVLTQAAGRIDRLNTKFVDLYYYHLKSRSGIDLAISKAIKEKKIFNEGRYVERSTNWFKTK